MSKPEPVAVPGYVAPQYEAGDLAVMKPEAIVEAKLAGHLDRILGVAPTPGLAADLVAGAGQLTAADAEVMTPAQIVDAKAAGRFDALLGKPATTNL